MTARWVGGPIRVVLADDDPRLRELVRETLGRDFAMVGEAGTGDDLVDVVEQLCAQGVFPDVAVLDYVMPGSDVFETARSLRELLPGLPIVVFSSLFDRTLTIDIEARGLHYVEKAAGLEALELALTAAVSLAPGA